MNKSYIVKSSNIFSKNKQYLKLEIKANATNTAIASTLSKACGRIKTQNSKQNEHRQ